MKAPPEYSNPRLCGHCGNHASMQILGHINDFKQCDDGEGFQWSEGPGYKLMKCPSCKNVELEGYDYCGALDPEEFNFRTIYPLPPSIPVGLPSKVKAEYLDAIKHRKSSPNAYGVLLGRVLEIACKDRKSKGQTLGQQIQNLASRNLIPPYLATVAFRANGLRILGAHAGAGKLKAKDVPILENLTRAFLESLYTSPYFVKKAEKALRKKRKPKK